MTPRTEAAPLFSPSLGVTAWEVISIGYCWALFLPVHPHPLQRRRLRVSARRRRRMFLGSARRTETTIPNRNIGLCMTWQGVFIFQLEKCLPLAARSCLLCVASVAVVLGCHDRVTIGKGYPFLRCERFCCCSVSSRWRGGLRDGMQQCAQGRILFDPCESVLPHAWLGERRN